MLDHSLDMCIYHSNCLDGFASAWVVRNRFLEANPSLEFVAATYNQEPPDVTGKDVIIVDFSYKRPVLLEMANKARSITIIDHHKTAQEDLVDLPTNVTTIFDMKHSGAILAWNTLFPNTNPHPILAYVEDRDLWKFKLEDSKAITTALYSRPFEFQEWDDILGNLEFPWTTCAGLIKEGHAIMRSQSKLIENALKKNTQMLMIDNHQIEGVNLTADLTSDAGHLLAKKNGFGVVWSVIDTDVVVSLRSTDEGPDVSQIAKIYNGGGHRNAAGFKVSLKDFVENFIV